MTPSNEPMESLSFLKLVIQHLKTLIGVGVVATILSSVVALMMDEYYESTVVMFATSQHSIGEQFFEHTKKNDLLSFGETEDAERLLQILDSHRIRDRIIKKYDLYNHYEIDPSQPGSKSDLIQRYNENVNARLTRFGSIHIRVLDTDRIQARDMANDIAFLADSVSNSMRNERAQQAYQIALATYENTRAEIQMIEDSLAVLQAMGIYNFELQVASLSSEYGRAMAEGNYEAAEVLKTDLANIAKIANEHKNLSASLSGEYAKSALLYKRVELMRVDAETQLPTSFVMDYAQPADKKAKPVRWLIVVMTCLVSVGASFFAILGYDAFQRNQLA